MNLNSFIASVSNGRDWVDYATLFLTFIGLVALIIYTFFTVRLERHTKRSLEETRRSNAATEESNKLTAESNRTQREALELGQRAWIVIDIEQPRESVIQLTVKNAGNTPATDLCIERRLGFDIPDNLPAKSCEISVSFVGSNSTVFLTPWPVSPMIGRIQQAVTQEKEAFYCYCEIAYRDVFNITRKTAICWQYVFMRTDISDGEFFWALVPKHTRIE